MSRRLIVAAGVAVLLAACGPEPAQRRQAAARPAFPTREFAPGFVDATREAGIAFVHDSALSSEKRLPETMGGGVAVFDADRDGFLDLAFVEGCPGARADGSPRGRIATYRCLPGGRFEALAASGEPWTTAGDFGMGVSVADFDGDGDDDLFVTGALGNALIAWERGRVQSAREHPAATWRDQGGADHPAWSTASLWCDYDRDGDVDLFVAGYVEWTAQSDIFTTLDGITKAFTTPDRYTGLPVRLYRNDGGGEFTDVTEAAGLLEHRGKGLGIAMWDFDGNGWPDIVVANDTRPNFLFMNQGDGTFREEGLDRNVAYDENGRARAGMGIDIADYGNDGVPGIAIGNFASEPCSLYRQKGATFESVAERAGLGAASLGPLAFGLAFADIDLDGILDLVVVNGHIEPDIAKFQAGQSHAQAPLLFLGVPGGGFVDASASAGPDFNRALVGRGLAVFDCDLDGDLDLLITQNGGPAVLLKNRLMETARRHWLRVVLVGAGRNTRAIGAIVTLRAGGRAQARMVRTGSSYLSQGDIFPTFGLGDVDRVDELRVRWPSGAETTHAVRGIDRTVVISE